jgi:membrane protease YdiL (CAAX protease family)
MQSQLVSKIKNALAPGFVENSLPFRLKYFQEVFLICLQNFPIVIVLVIFSKLASGGAKNINSLSSINFLILAGIDLVLLGPIQEEIIFRGWLTNRKSGVLFSLFFTIWLISIHFNGFLTIFTGVIILIAAFYLSATATSLITRNYPMLFLFSSLVFGLIHITNYVNLQSPWYLYPVITSPQIFCGFKFAQVRNNYGLKYSIFLHSCFNGFGFLLNLGILAMNGKLN